MSGKNNQPGRGKNFCPPSGNKKPCQARPRCQDPANPPVPCNNQQVNRAPCEGNNNNEPASCSAGRNRLSGAQQQQPPKNDQQNALSTVEAEVDRLVDAAKQYSEKEKLKLKQFYEEEILRKKKSVIQEFKCAMERDVIAPMKTNLCTCERELQELKKKYDKVLKGSSGNISQNEMEVLEKELSKAQKERNGLAEVIENEVKRKSIKMGKDLQRTREEEDELGYDYDEELDGYNEGNEFEEEGPLETEMGGKPSHIRLNSTAETKSIISTGEEADEATGDGENAVGRQSRASEGQNRPSTARASEGQNRPSTARGSEGQNRPSTARASEGKNRPSTAGSMNKDDGRGSMRKSQGDSAKRSLARKSLANKTVPLTEEEIRELEVEKGMPDETKKLKRSIKVLTHALNDAKEFAQEEIAELIREQGLREALERQLDSLRVENGSLRSRVDQWLEQIDVLDNGDLSGENSKLRRRIQELEGDRTRAEVEAELRKLKGELDDVIEEGRRLYIEQSEGTDKAAGSPGHDMENNEMRRQCSVDCSEIAAPYIAKIKELEDRIKELEDQLITFSEMERRIQELQLESDELKALRKRFEEVNRELNELKNTPPPQCPIDEDGLEDLKKRLEDALRKLNLAHAESTMMLAKTNELENQNLEMAKQVAEFELEHERTVQLESMHAQMLEEKRRKSEEAKKLAGKLAELEEDDRHVHEELESTQQQLADTEKDLKDSQDENVRLSDKIQELKDQIERDFEKERRLQEELVDKENEIRNWESKYDTTHEENDRLKRELDELRDRFEQMRRKRDDIEKELREAYEQIERNHKEFQHKLQEQAKKAQERCSELSNKGRCILEHEKKCLAVTTQLAEDNEAMQDRIRLLEDQLEKMMSMENRTRGMFKEIGELQKRAKARTDELEELKKLPETCQIDRMPSPISPLESYPSLPVPSDEPLWGDESRNDVGATEGKPKTKSGFGEDGKEKTRSANDLEGKKGRTRSANDLSEGKKDRTRSTNNAQEGKKERIGTTNNAQEGKKERTGSTNNAQEGKKERIGSTNNAQEGKKERIGSTNYSSESGKEGKNPDCGLLHKKMAGLEKERNILNEDLRSRLRALEDVQKQLEEVTKEETELKNEMDKSCSN